jgi:hypothetical protein
MCHEPFGHGNQGKVYDCGMFKMTGIEIHQELSSSAKGALCTGVELYARHCWSFDFEGRLRLNVQCPWRIVSDSGIALGSEDDSQYFGLPSPVNGGAVALHLLAATALKQVLITEKTGDVVFEFESGIRLEVFNNSSGYEGWNCGTSSGFEVIGMGGGTTANVRSK